MLSQYLLIFWLSLTNTESETNPNNNLMMRQAGLSKVDMMANKVADMVAHKVIDMGVDIYP